MAFKYRIGVTKEQVRRIALSKLKIVYRDWDFAKGALLAPGAEGRAAADRCSIVRDCTPRGTSRWPV